MPQDGGDGGGDDPLANLKADIATGNGRALLVETTAAAWGEGRAAAPVTDWKQQRIGPDPPAALATLRSDAALAVLDACGAVTLKEACAARARIGRRRHRTT